jgi:hypothetical protein
MMTFETARAMTNAEINSRIRELDYILMGDCANDAWEVAYQERNKLTSVLDERYREENQDAFDSFYAKHIKGKSWEEINPEAWSFYSDWHKDMYGFRPRHI